MEPMNDKYPIAIYIIKSDDLGGCDLCMDYECAPAPAYSEVVEIYSTNFDMVHLCKMCHKKNLDYLKIWLGPDYQTRVKILDDGIEK